MAPLDPSDPPAGLSPRNVRALTEAFVVESTPAEGMALAYSVDGERTYMVAVADEKYTTRQCHECDQLAAVGSETITCTTGWCLVETVGRDQSAAATLAKRALARSPR